MQKIVLKQWNDFLDRCQIDQSKMPADQHREMKRAFFGGAGQILIHLCEVLPPTQGLEFLTAVNVINEEISVFWQIEQVTQDAQMAANPKPPKPAPAGDYIPYTGDWVGLLKKVIPFLEDYKSAHPSADAAAEVGKAIDDAKLIVSAADDMKKLEGSRPKTFASELTTLVNRYSKENGSNTPDYVLANFLQNSLAAFDLAVNMREGHPEPDLITRIKNKLRNTAREVMDEIEQKTSKTLHGYEKNVEYVKTPELTVGLKFCCIHQPGQVYEIMYIDREANKCNVEITLQDRRWQDNGWCMEYMRTQFQSGEYYEKPKFKPGGMMSGDGRPGGDDREVADAIVDRHLDKIKNRVFDGSPHHPLDEKGFFFYLKTGGIGWCRMYGGAPWFMAQDCAGQWFTGKQVNQTEIWNAKASEVSAEEDAALRKIIPNE